MAKERINNIPCTIYKCHTPFCENYRRGDFRGSVCYKNCSEKDIVYRGNSNDIPEDFWDRYFIVDSCLHVDSLKVPFEKEIWVAPIY